MNEAGGGDEPKAVPAVGTCLASQYELVEVLGRGGFGTVFGALDRRLGRSVAVKVLNEPSAADCERFVREARIVAALDNEHVVRLFDSGVAEGGIPYLVMERLRGVSLSQHLRASGGRLEQAEAVGLVIEACAGLAEAHARGIVHRDLKPQNLFLAERRDGSTVLKVLDFGIAKWSAGSASLTSHHVAMGTLRYMAPEQIRDAKTADPRADIWALGVVLYELLTGMPIFDAESDAAFGALVLAADPVPVSERAPDVVDEALAAVVHRCLARAREDRIVSVAALSEALAPFAREPHRRVALSIRATSGLLDTSLHRNDVSASAETAATALADDGPTQTATQIEVSPPSPPLAWSEGRWLAVVAAAAVVTLGGVQYASSAGRAQILRGPAANAKRFAPAVPTINPSQVAPSPVVSESPSAVTVEDAAPVVRPPAVPSAVRSAAPTTDAGDASDGDRKFLQACLSVPGLVPTFLTASRDPYGQCASLRHMGCPMIQSLCRQARSAEKNASCNAFVSTIRANGGCP